MRCTFQCKLQVQQPFKNMKSNLTCRARTQRMCMGIIQCNFDFFLNENLNDLHCLRILWLAYQRGSFKFPLKYAPDRTNYHQTVIFRRQFYSLFFLARLNRSTRTELKTKMLQLIAQNCTN